MFTISNEKYEEIANLFLLLSSSNSFAFDLLRLINRIIPFDCGIYLSPRNGMIDNAVSYADTKEIRKTLESVSFNQADPILKLGNYVVGLNPFSDTEVFNIEETNCLDKSYRNTLQRLGITYMLMLTIDRSGDGLRLMRQHSSGTFSREEIEIANYLSDALGYINEAQKKNQQTIAIAERHRTLNEMSPFGLFFFDSRFELIESNTTGLARAAEITGQKRKEDILSQLMPYVKTMHTQLVTNKQKYSALSVDNYILDLHIIRGEQPDGNPFNYSVLYIFNKRWFRNAVLSNGEMIAEELDLTEREKAIFQLLIRGYSNNSIAEELFISSFTVKDHLKNIFKKAGVKSRSELLVKTYTNDL